MLHAHLLRALSLSVLALSFAGCASLPRMDSEANLRARALVRRQGGVTVRSTPLSDREQRSILSLGPRRAIQPIWVEVENGTRRPMTFLPVGISRDYLPPDEVAFRNHPLGGFHIASKIDAWHEAHAMPRTIPPGQRRAGLVYAPQPPGAIAWNIELLGGGELRRFAFAAPIPGFRADFDLPELERRSTSRGANQSWSGLRAELEKMPACATDRHGRRPGDPLNVVIVGPLETMLEVAIRNGWKLAEPITLSSALREAGAVIIGGGYPTGPVSPMFFAGRQEDLALQRPRSSASHRHHMRLWLTDWRCGNQPVWVGQISRDIGVRFTRHTWNLTTHRIAADVDESRDNLVAEAISTQSVSAVGWVKGVGAAPRSAPRANLTGDPYFTDGRRAVLFFSSKPIPTIAVRRLTGTDDLFE